MRQLRNLGAGIGILLFSTLAVTNASATLWLENGASLSSETAAAWHGELALHFSLGFLGPFLLRCRVLFKGTVGPGALGLVSELEGPSGERNSIKCTVSKTGNCANAEGEQITVTAINLPWHALLELSGGSTIDHFLSEAGKEPGYEFPCPKIFGFKDSCKGLDTTNFSRNGTNGAVFESPGTSKAPCSDGAEMSILSSLEWLGAQVS